MVDVALLALLALVLGLFMGAALGLARLSARSGPTPQATMPVGPSFSALTQLFALIVALHGNDLWGDYQRAEAELMRVRSSLDSLERFARSDLLASTPPMAAAVARYSARVGDHEWRTHATPAAARELEEALQALRMEVVRAGGDMSAPLHANLLHLFDEVAKAHAARMWSEASQPGLMIWAGMVVLCLLCNVGLGLVHQDKPRAAWRVLLLFNLAAGTVFWLMLRYEFRGPLAAALRGAGGA